MPIKLSELTDLTPPKLLIVGAPGTGKTANALTVGDAGEVLDLDRGLKTGLTLDDKWKSTRLKIDVTPCYDSNPKVPTAYRKYKDRLIAIANGCADGTYKKRVLITDSLTSLCDHSLRYVTSGKISTVFEAPKTTQPEWGLAIAEVEQCMMILRQLPIAVIVLAHELPLIIPASPGVAEQVRIKVWAFGAKLPHKMPGFFEEIWNSNILIGGGNTRKYVFRTKGTSSIECKSRGNLEDQIDQDLGMVAILKKLNYDATMPVPKPAANYVPTVPPPHTNTPVIVTKP